MTDKRRPQVSPGYASVPEDATGDFTLPAALYVDAVSLCEAGREAEERGDRDAAARFKRSAVFSAFAFFEATVNQAAFGHAGAHGTVLGQIERDVLEEKETTIDERGMVVRRDKFYRMEARFCFLSLFLSGREFDRGTVMWADFLRAKALRDKWTHPKPPFEASDVSAEAIKGAIGTLRQMLVTLSEMMQISPPLWMQQHDQMALEIRRQANAKGTNRQAAASAFQEEGA